VAIITVLFMLPQVSPINWTTFNYAPIAVGAVLARKWFTGPRVQGDEAELEAIEGRRAT